MRQNILMTLIIAAAVTASSVAVSQAKQIELRFAYPNPPTASQYGDFIVPLAQKIDKDSAGLLHVKIFVGHSLVSPRNCLDRVERNVAQIAFCILGPVSRQFPQTLVATLPAVASNAHEAGLAWPAPTISAIG